MSKTKLYKNEEQITYKILSYMTVLVTAKKNKKQNPAKKQSTFLNIFFKDTCSL